MPDNQQQSDQNATQTDNNTQGSESIFSDDSAQMRSDLKTAIDNAMPQTPLKPSAQFQAYFEFIPQIMDVRGFDEVKKNNYMQRFYFGIEAIALERMVEILDEEAKEKFTKLFETTDPSTLSQAEILSLQQELKSKIDNAKIFKAYITAITAMVDLIVEEITDEASEAEEVQIRRILIEQQQKIEEKTVNVLVNKTIT